MASVSELQAARSCLVVQVQEGLKLPFGLSRTQALSNNKAALSLMAKAMHWKPLVLTIHADIAACMVRQKHGVPETTMQIMAQNMAKPDRVKLHWEHVEITDKEALGLAKLLNDIPDRSSKWQG